MGCVVCKDESKKSPYRCPQCKSPYCSVICYKEHKLTCSQPVSSAPTTSPAPTSGSIRHEASPFDQILENPRIQELLKFEGISTYLRLVADILHDPKVSGEHTAEGRRIVALKKLRELRKGGREENEAIEELATTVVQLVESKSADALPSAHAEDLHS